MQPKLKTIVLAIIMLSTLMISQCSQQLHTQRLTWEHWAAHD